MLSPRSSKGDARTVLFGLVVCLLPGALLASAACGDDPEPSDPAIPLPNRPSDEAGTSDALVAADTGPNPYVDFDINHVLITGGSNAVSNGATPPLTTAPAFSNLRFDTGVMPMKGGYSNPGNHGSARIPGCDDEGCISYDPPKSLTPLAEGDMFFDYPVETCATSLANEVSNLATTVHKQVRHDVLVTVHGRSGNTYQCLRRGGCNYKPDYLNAFAQAQLEVTSAKGLAAALAKTYAVRAVVAIHGESDHISYSAGRQEFPLDATDGGVGAIADYSDGLLEWQRDYEAAIKEITGQTLPVPLFISQLSGWTDTAMSRVAQFQLDAHVKSKGTVVLVGPTYALPIRQDDCTHFTNEAERRLGQYFAKAYASTVFEGKTWEPVRPMTVTRDGAIIKVVFHVPKPPLVLDSTLIDKTNLRTEGFDYLDASGSSAPAITKVEITAPDTVTITLAAVPAAAAANKKLRYAMNQPSGACAGNPKGARGTLRDSDDTMPYGLPAGTPPLFNWAVHFEVPVP